MRTTNLMMITCLTLGLAACSDDGGTGSSGESSESGTAATETGEPTGEESESDSASTQPGDGDGDTAGDGDGDPGGDGDGDTGGDGDGDPGGDGDGDTGGDGDGDTGGDACNCDVGNCVNDMCLVAASCLDLEEADPNLPSGVYELDPDLDGPEDPFLNYCDLETNGGGWTLVLKVDADSGEFGYDSELWEGLAPYEAQNYEFDRLEAKLPSWSTVALTEVMVAMEAPVGDAEITPQYLVLDGLGGASLWELIALGNYVQGSASREDWLDLVPGAELQANCNRQGFNVTGENPNNDWHQVRIGIIGNNENDCNSPDSRLGIGGKGTACGTSNAATGNFVGCNNNDVDIFAFGWVFVR